MNPFEELQQLIEKAQEERRLLQMGHKPVGNSLTSAATTLSRVNTLIKEIQAAKALAAAKEAEAPVEPVKVEPEPPPSVDPAPVEVDTHAKRKAK